ncbi:hypothetical protein ACFIJ5_12385 [Haloimpatiens sp. FM7330]|uniref:hypothetical protein n=1 Tax=Haloimpatiens sp. FM7330 TaxID=3298610 RepID=UPI003643CA93
MDDMMDKRHQHEKDMEDEYDMVPISSDMMSMQMMPYNYNMQDQMMMQQMMMQQMMGMQCMSMMPNTMNSMQCAPMPPMMPNEMNSMQCTPMMPNEMMNEEGMEEYETDSEDEDDMRYKKKPRDVNRILRKIEMYNPGVFRMMRSYGIPYPVARRICRRIIRLTLMYCDD